MAGKFACDPQEAELVARELTRMRSDMRLSPPHPLEGSYAAGAVCACAVRKLIVAARGGLARHRSLLEPCPVIVSLLLSALCPRIENGLGPDIASAIFTQNPACAFAVQWRQP
ncbi:hypothetical protein ACWY4P_36970 [Streptomyces sp. LZ34]